MTARRREFLLALLLPVSASAAPTDNGSDWGIERLMDSLKGVRSSSARFTERKEIGVLSTPLESTGVLLYVAPDQLQKETLTPEPSIITVAGQRLTIRENGKPPRTLSLSEYPELEALVAAIRATLAGDLPTLNRFYSVGLQGRPEAWTLSLVPRAQRVREVVSLVRIQGDGVTLTSVETLQPDGDRTVIAITTNRG